MAYCPVDMTACVDDLCYGGGCIESGESMLVRCLGPECGALIDDDGFDFCDECERDCEEGPA